MFHFTFFSYITAFSITYLVIASFTLLYPISEIEVKILNLTSLFIAVVDEGTLPSSAK